jgi:hypothetical protein
MDPRMIPRSPWTSKPTRATHDILANYGVGMISGTVSMDTAHTMAAQSAISAAQRLARGELFFLTSSNTQQASAPTVVATLAHHKYTVKNATPTTM